MDLKPRQFLEMAADAALAALAEDKPQVRVRASMFQLYYTSRAQHYEAWLRRNDGLVEIGLHFEGPAEENQRRLGALAEAMPEIAGRLGPHVDLEDWTASWTRLHEVQPMPPLSNEAALELGQRLASFVRVLEPIVRPLGEMPAATERTNRRWERHRRAG